MQPSSLWSLAIGGALVASAAIAAATQVNVADPNATSRVAKVEVGNRLAVQEVSPSTFYHTSSFYLPQNACTPVAAPPAGKGLVVRQVRVDIVANPTAGFVALYLGSDCSVDIGQVHPATTGQSIVTFDPGMAVPSGSGLSVYISGSPTAHIFVDGYKVDSSVVPQAGGQTVQVSGKSSL